MGHQLDFISILKKINWFQFKSQRSEQINDKVNTSINIPTQMQLNINLA
jgi:hypothetical protein